MGISQSRHSRRIVPISRSQSAFACGVRTGVFNTCRPIDAIARSTVAAKMLSRSWRTNRWDVRGDDRAKLLDRPRRCGMLGDIPVEDPTGADLEDDEHREDAEAGGNRREEVTGHD